MTLTIIGGLALWFLCGCIVAAILCRIFHAAEPRREGECDSAPDHGTDECRGRGLNLHYGISTASQERNNVR